jgi:hypothetical protein
LCWGIGWLPADAIASGCWECDLRDVDDHAGILVMTLRLPMTAAHIIALTGGCWPCQNACSAAAEDRRADMGDQY